MLASSQCILDPESAAKISRIGVLTGHAPHLFARKLPSGNHLLAKLRGALRNTRQSTERISQMQHEARSARCKEILECARTIANEQLSIHTCMHELYMKNAAEARDRMPAMFARMARLHPLVCACKRAVRTQDGGMPKHGRPPPVRRRRADPCSCSDGCINAECACIANARACGRKCACAPGCRRTKSVDKAFRLIARRKKCMQSDSGSPSDVDESFM